MTSCLLQHEGESWRLTRVQRVPQCAVPSFCWLAKTVPPVDWGDPGPCGLRPAHSKDVPGRCWSLRKKEFKHRPDTADERCKQRSSSKCKQAPQARAGRLESRTLGARVSILYGQVLTRGAASNTCGGEFSKAGLPAFSSLFRRGFQPSLSAGGPVRFGPVSRGCLGRAARSGLRLSDRAGRDVPCSGLLKPNELPTPTRADDRPESGAKGCGAMRSKAGKGTGRILDARRNWGSGLWTPQQPGPPAQSQLRGGRPQRGLPTGSGKRLRVAPPNRKRRLSLTQEERLQHRA